MPRSIRAPPLALGASIEGKNWNTMDMLQARVTALYELLNFMPMPKCQDEPPVYPEGTRRRGTGF